MQLTTAQEKYLRAIYELTLDGTRTSVSEVAALAGVTKASASVSIKWLEGQGLVEKQRQKWIALTGAGTHAAVLTYGKWEIIQSYLVRCLQVPEPIASLDAGRLEPVISLDTLCALCRQTRQGVCAADCDSCTQTGQ